MHIQIVNVIVNDIHEIKERRVSSGAPGTCKTKNECVSPFVPNCDSVFLSTFTLSLIFIHVLFSFAI